jgi:hypothetical protein
VKVRALLAAPVGVRTVIGPALVPHGTTAVIRVAESTVNVAGTPWNATLVVLVNPEPRMVTVVPIGPRLGENDVSETAATSARVAARTCTLDAFAGKAEAACAGMAGAIRSTPEAARAIAVSVLLTKGSDPVIRDPFRLALIDTALLEGG